MLNFLLERKFNNVLCLGINESTIPIYKFLNFYLGSLNQFYIPNKKVKEYKIAQYNFNDQIIKRVPKRDMRYKLKEVTSSFLKKNFQFDQYKKTGVNKNAMISEEHPEYLKTNQYIPQKKKVRQSPRGKLLASNQALGQTGKSI